MRAVVVALVFLLLCAGIGALLVSRRASPIASAPARASLTDDWKSGPGGLWIHVVEQGSGLAVTGLEENQTLHFVAIGPDAWAEDPARPSRLPRQLHWSSGSLELRNFDEGGVADVQTLRRLR